MDMPSVCCMCGDVGFAEKLFCCAKCRSRFQHSYCSNYCYALGTSISLCNWCASDERIVKTSAKRLPAKAGGPITRSGYSGDRIKEPHGHENADPRSTPTSHFPKHAGRKYKLLKDVLC